MKQSKGNKCIKENKIKNNTRKKVNKIKTQFV